MEDARTVGGQTTTDGDPTSGVYAVRSRSGRARHAVVHADAGYYVEAFGLVTTIEACSDAPVGALLLRDGQPHPVVVAERSVRGWELLSALDATGLCDGGRRA